MAKGKSISKMSKKNNNIKPVMGPSPNKKLGGSVGFQFGKRPSKKATRNK